MATIDAGKRRPRLRATTTLLRSAGLWPLSFALLSTAAGVAIWLLSATDTERRVGDVEVAYGAEVVRPVAMPVPIPFRPGNASFALAEIAPSRVLAGPPEGMALPPLPVRQPAVVEPARLDTPARVEQQAAPAPVAPAAGPGSPAQAPQPTPTALAAAAPGATQPELTFPEVSSGPLSAVERRFLDAANAERTTAGLEPFALDQGLVVIARIRSRQLVDEGYFGHVDPGGHRMYVELLAYFGYTPYAWAGENLAMNNYSDAESPERAVAALMQSPAHRSNILDSDFTRVGVGLAVAADGRKFYAMIFLS